jgi:hypothetical protein
VTPVGIPGQRSGRLTHPRSHLGTCAGGKPVTRGDGETVGWARRQREKLGAGLGGAVVVQVRACLQARN